MNEQKFDRFKDAPWFNTTEEEVLIGGAGGIGSWLALLINRAGYVPSVYDFDIYEAHNMGGQFCKTNDMGKSKVESLQDSIKLFCDNEIFIFNEKYTSESMAHKYMLAGFDNMEARRTMFDSWRKSYADDPEAIFIDGRLLAEQIQIFCIRGGDTKAIENYNTNALFSDAEVEEAPCTMKQTSHIATMIASLMVSFFTNHITNVKEKVETRSVPYFYEYFAPIGYNIVEE